MASYDGKVYKAGDGYNDGYGTWVAIEHNYNGKTIYTIYAHMREGSLKVKQGDVVGAGTVLGMMGSTGNSTGQHLHFEIREISWSPRSSTAKDPANYINKNKPRP